VILKIPLVLAPQPEGGYTVTSPLLPELVTEGDTPEQIQENVRDCLAAVIEIYEDTGRELPAAILAGTQNGPLHMETLVEVP
jgi:antitoxin HicB